LHATQLTAEVGADSRTCNPCNQELVIYLGIFALARASSLRIDLETAEDASRT
jgi:hypothetical protein